jgi:hypothetical protein
MAADQTLTTSPATVTWNYETFDVGNNMSSTTFTAPITGKYMFCAGGLFDGHTEGDYITMQLYTTNYTYSTDIGRGNRGGTNHGTISLLVDMDKGDTADLRVVNNTSARGQLKNDQYFTYYSGHLVC